MGDVLKDIFEAANNRIRSPFVGSIIIVFLAVNWRPVFNLLFGEAEVLVRIAHFDNVTTWQSLYVWPIVGGVVFALASPWLKLAGAWAARVPAARLKEIQNGAAHFHNRADLQRETELEDIRAALDEARARRKIDAAKWESEAEEVGGKELREEVHMSRRRLDEELRSEPLEISELADSILNVAASAPIGKLEFFEGKADSDRRLDAGGEHRLFANRRELLNAQNAIQELAREGLIEGNNPWFVTTRGYDLLEGKEIISLS